MTMVRIVSNAPLEIAGRVGETEDPRQNPVQVKIDDELYMVERQYVRRVPWPIRLAAHILAGGQGDVTE